MNLVLLDSLDRLLDHPPESPPGDDVPNDAGHVQQVRVEQLRARNAVLLAFYEAVHLNRHFIATLTHFQVNFKAFEAFPVPTSKLLSVQTRLLRELNPRTQNQ